MPHNDPYSHPIEENENITCIRQKIGLHVCFQLTSMDGLTAVISIETDKFYKCYCLFGLFQSIILLYKPCYLVKNLTCML